MKKIILSAAFALMGVCCNAQFVLTPNAGLLADNGAYVINHLGTEEENYNIAKKAAISAFSDAQFVDLESNKSFKILYVYKNHDKLPGALIATDWTIKFTLKIETQNDKVLVSFDEAGIWEAQNKNAAFNMIPSAGKNTMLKSASGITYMFNSKGKPTKGGKKIITAYENIANGIVRDFESEL